MSGHRRTVCVVGAGTSGLAAIHCLTRAGHEVTAFEAGSALGGMWRYENDNGLSAAYGSLSANTSRKRMEYSSLPMPSSAPVFPKRSDVVAYLEAFAREYGLERQIEFNAWVERVQSASVDGAGADRGERWEVTLRGAPPREFDAVVVASGHYWDAQVPQLPESSPAISFMRATTARRSGSPDSGWWWLGAPSRRSTSPQRSPPSPSARSSPAARFTI